MMKDVVFLSSMHRSGSTLLASLLGQRPDTYVSPTSNLHEIMGAVTTAFKRSRSFPICGTDDELYRILGGVADAKYADRDEPIIIDKNRSWPNPNVMDTMSKVLDKPIKIIATVRPMAECVVSFYEIHRHAVPCQFCSHKALKDVKSWVDTSPDMKYLIYSQKVLQRGYKNKPENFCLIEYDKLCDNPQGELDRIADFLGVERYTYNPHIDQVDESAWGIEGLHTLGNTIKKTKRDTKQILGDELFEYFQDADFWL